MDLSKVISAEREGITEESLSLEKEKSNPLLLKSNGIDYDAFLSSYPRSFSHTAQMKSLIEVSRRVSAVAAALFIRSVTGYAPDLTIGVGEKSTGCFILTRRSRSPSGFFLRASWSPSSATRRRSARSVAIRRGRPALREAAAVPARDVPRPGSFLMLAFPVDADLQPSGSSRSWASGSILSRRAQFLFLLRLEHQKADFSANGSMASLSVAPEAFHLSAKPLTKLPLLAYAFIVHLSRLEEDHEHTFVRPSSSRRYFSRLDHIDGCTRDFSFHQPSKRPPAS